MSFPCLNRIKPRFFSLVFEGPMIMIQWPLQHLLSHFLWELFSFRQTSLVTLFPISLCFSVLPGEDAPYLLFIPVSYPTHHPSTNTHWSSCLFQPMWHWWYLLLWENQKDHPIQAEGMMVSEEFLQNSRTNVKGSQKWNHRWKNDLRHVQNSDREEYCGQ